MSNPYKLLSPKRTLLGVVTFPDRFEDVLMRQCRERGYAYLRFKAVSPEERSRLMLYIPDQGETISYKIGCIRMFYDHGFDDRCVELDGITVKEFEQLPGCTFAPSMAYLETLIGGE
jgi:hypothetical protein